MVGRLASEQVRRGHSVRVVTLDKVFATGEALSPRSSANGVEVVRVPFRGSTKYPIAPSVLAQLGPVDIVHVHGVDFFFDFLSATRALHRRPMIATTHGGFFHTRDLAVLKRIWFATLTRISTQGYQALVACSAADEALFRPLGREKLTLIENGVAIDRFETASPEPRKALVTLGRFSVNKRLDRLLDTFAALLRKDPDFTLSIIGAASDLGPEDVRRLAAERGIAGQVRVEANLSDTEINTHLAGSSLFVSASEYEGFGLVLVEALGAGLLPVVHQNVAFREFSHRHGGIVLANFGEPDAAADSILRTWQGRIDRGQGLMAEARRIAAAFAWSAAAARYDEVYERAIATPRGA